MFDALKNVPLSHSTKTSDRAFLDPVGVGGSIPLQLSLNSCPIVITLASPSVLFRSSIKADSPLVKHLRVPAVFDVAQTEIVVQNMQFFLGPAGSGAPMHYHRAAYNVLVAGRKEWVLLPPRSAVYSKRHPKDFFAKDVPAMEAAGIPVIVAYG